MIKKQPFSSLPSSLLPSGLRPPTSERDQDGVRRQPVSPALPLCPAALCRQQDHLLQGTEGFRLNWAEKCPWDRWDGQALVLVKARQQVAVETLIIRGDPAVMAAIDHTVNEVTDTWG